MLIDASAHEFPLRNLLDPRSLFISRNSVTLSFVFNGFEIQQTQVFAILAMLVGILAEVRGLPGLGVAE